MGKNKKRVAVSAVVQNLMVVSLVVVLVVLVVAVTSTPFYSTTIIRSCTITENIITRTRTGTREKESET